MKTGPLEIERETLSGGSLRQVPHIGFWAR